VTKLNQLTLDPKNARTHDRRNLDAIKQSISEVGPGRSIVIDENDVILAGNGVTQAAIEAGLTKLRIIDAEPDTIMAVRVTGLTDEQKTRLALFDNRASELGAWDARVLSEINRDDPEAMKGMFDKPEWAELMKQVKPEPAPDPGPQIDRAAELQGKWSTRLGQLWRIPSLATPGAEHRIICGDCTDRDVVARVMGGEKAALAPVDPPYNVGFDYDGETVDDSKTSKKHEEFARSWFVVCQEFSTHQIVTPGGVNLSRWLRWFDAYHWGTWIKTNAMTNGRTSRFWCWEPVLFFGDKWKKIRTNDIFDYPVTVQDGVANHPCPKPLEMWSDLIENYSEPNAIILDCFIGSGTTLIACERLSRLGRGIEISPGYVAVALERLAGLGLTPELIP